tara:strand:+ start:5868 stop:6098 length:231 start_codon:yes stop_codon:yes gene_type:complete
MILIKQNPNSVLLQLTKRQLNIIAQNLDMVMNHDLQYMDEKEHNKLAIHEDCVAILSELQSIGIWGEYPKSNNNKN